MPFSLKDSDYEFVLKYLRSEVEEDKLFGLFAIASIWIPHDGLSLDKDFDKYPFPSESLEFVRRGLYDKSRPIVIASCWTWAVVSYHSDVGGFCKVSDLDRLLELMVKQPAGWEARQAEVALWTQVGLKRDFWVPVLNDDKTVYIRDVINEKFDERDSRRHHRFVAALLVAYHHRFIVSDSSLTKFFTKLKSSHFLPRRADGTERRNLDAVLNTLKK